LPTVSTPFVGYDGDPFGTGVYVYVDGQPVVKARDTVDAFLLSYQLYVAVWLEYPRKAALSLKFIEMVIFGQPGTPPKKLADLLHLSNIDYK